MREVDDILALLLRLSAQGITIIMIEHIMRAVMRFSQRLIVRGRPASRSPRAIAGRGRPANPAVEKAYLGE